MRTPGFWLQSLGNSMSYAEDKMEVEAQASVFRIVRSWDDLWNYWLSTEHHLDKHNTVGGDPWVIVAFKCERTLNTVNRHLGVGKLNANAIGGQKSPMWCLSVLDFRGTQVGRMQWFEDPQLWLLQLRLSSGY